MGIEVVIRDDNDCESIGAFKNSQRRPKAGSR